MVLGEKAASSACNSIAQVFLLETIITLNYELYSLHSVIQNIKQMCVQGLKLNKDNYLYSFKDILK